MYQRFSPWSSRPIPRPATQSRTIGWQSRWQTSAIRLYAEDAGRSREGSKGRERGRDNIRSRIAPLALRIKIPTKGRTAAGRDDGGAGDPCEYQKSQRTLVCLSTNNSAIEPFANAVISITLTVARPWQIA